MVLPPALVADGAISRAVMASYSGRGTLVVAPLVAIGARLIGVSILAVFDLILFSQGLKLHPIRAHLRLEKRE